MARSNFSSWKQFLLSKKQVLFILQNHFSERNHTSFDLAIHVFASVDVGKCGWMYWLSCADQSPLRWWLSAEKFWLILMLIINNDQKDCENHHQAFRIESGMIPFCHILQSGISAEQILLPDFVFPCSCVTCCSCVNARAFKLTLWVWPSIVFCGLKQGSKRHSLLLIFQCVSEKSDYEVCLKKLFRCG